MELRSIHELVARATDPSSNETRWLGYGATPSSCPTTAAGPGELVVPSCPDNATCPLAFVLNDVFYTVSCAAIREWAVGDDMIGSGDFHGDNVTVHRIDGVDDSVMVALSVPGGFCSENDPDERHTPWSMAFADEADDDQLSNALCEVGELSAAQRLADRCHLGQELLTCGSGPGFPPDVLDDLTLYPQPTNSFGADIAALVGTDDPNELVGWHAIVEEQQSDGSYIQLLLREDPNSGELQYLLDGSADTFSARADASPKRSTSPMTRSNYRGRYICARWSMQTTRRYWWLGRVRRRCDMRRLVSSEDRLFRLQVVCRPVVGCRVGGLSHLA